MQEKFSLLWPENEEQENIIDQNDSIINDLSLERISQSLSFNHNFKIDIGFLLSILSKNEKIIKYRLDILEDLIENPLVLDCFESSLSLIEELSYTTSPGRFSAPPFQQVIWRLGELDIYTECVRKLSDSLNDASLNSHSEGIKNLASYLNAISENEAFKSVVAVLPELKNTLKGISSVTIGLNLDNNLKAVEATILSINDKPFKGESLLNRLLNSKKTGGDSYTGMSPLMKVENHAAKPSDPPIYDAFQVTLFEQINRIFNNTAKTIDDTLKKYVSINSRFLIGLKGEIAFFVGAAKLINKITSSGINMCKPEILPAEERTFCTQELFNLNLALNLYYKNPDALLNQLIVTNDVEFGDCGRIFILTGPNQGGKTTYIQAIGIAQFLCQLGIFVPGSKACISPVDRIFTHFPVEEKPDANVGRLGEECKRITEILTLATPQSLILLNESLSSTSFSEGLFISREIIAALRVLGVRAVFATHFHELAHNLESLNGKIPGSSKIISMVSGIMKDERTYKIRPGPPQGLSYAKDIASKHGLDFSKIMALFQSRELIGPDAKEELLDISDILE